MGCVAARGRIPLSPPWYHTVAAWLGVSACHAGAERFTIAGYSVILLRRQAHPSARKLPYRTPMTDERMSRFSIAKQELRHVPGAPMTAKTRIVLVLSLCILGVGIMLFLGGRVTRDQMFVLVAVVIVSDLVAYTLAARRGTEFRHFSEIGQEYSQEKRPNLSEMSDKELLAYVKAHSKVKASYRQRRQFWFRPGAAMTAGDRGLAEDVRQGGRLHLILPAKLPHRDSNPTGDSAEIRLVSRARLWKLWWEESRKELGETLGALQAARNRLREDGLTEAERKAAEEALDAALYNYRTALMNREDLEHLMDNSGYTGH